MEGASSPALATPHPDPGLRVVRSRAGSSLGFSPEGGPEVVKICHSHNCDGSQNLGTKVARITFAETNKEAISFKISDFLFFFA